MVNFLGIKVAEAVTHQVRDVDGGLRLAEESLPLLVRGARRESRERLGWLSNVSLLFGHVFDLLRGLNHCVERHVALQGHQVLARAVDRLEKFFLYRGVLVLKRPLVDLGGTASF